MMDEFFLFFVEENHCYPSNNITKRIKYMVVIKAGKCIHMPQSPIDCDVQQK